MVDWITPLVVRALRACVPVEEIVSLASWQPEVAKEAFAALVRSPRSHVFSADAFPAASQRFVWDASLVVILRILVIVVLRIIVVRRSKETRGSDFVASFTVPAASQVLLAHLAGAVVRGCEQGACCFLVAEAHGFGVARPLTRQIVFAELAVARACRFVVLTRCCFVADSNGVGVS